MTRITWIIIILIILSLCVTCLEVLLRFAILQAKGKAVGAESLGMMRRGAVAGPTLLAGRGVVWSINGAKKLFG
jgi:hypothetical protein